MIKSAANLFSQLLQRGDIRLYQREKQGKVSSTDHVHMRINFCAADSNNAPR